MRSRAFCPGAYRKLRLIGSYDSSRQWGWNQRSNFDVRREFARWANSQRNSISHRVCHGQPAPSVERLADVWERLVTFYQFPREHWPHLRTTNVVESLFATVRIRATAAKRFKKVENATALIWKILQVAESTFRRLKRVELLPAVYAGAQYVDGMLKMRTQQKIAA